jgi:hypothetical protein
VANPICSLGRNLENLPKMLDPSLGHRNFLLGRGLATPDLNEKFECNEKKIAIIRFK